MLNLKTGNTPDGRSKSEGFSQIFFIIIILLVILATIVIGALVLWAQKIDKEFAKTKPGLHLQQISDPEKFVDQNQVGATQADCGGFADKACPAGFICNVERNSPNANENV